MCHAEGLHVSSALANPPVLEKLLHYHADGHGEMGPLGSAFHSIDCECLFLDQVAVLSTY